MNWIKYTCLVISCVIASILAGSLIRLDGGLSLAYFPPSTKMSYADFAAISLSAATLVLAGVAVVTGILAIISWQGIKSEAQIAIRKSVEGKDKQIEEAVEKKVENWFLAADKEGKLDTALEKAVLRRTSVGTLGLSDDADIDESE